MNQSKRISSFLILPFLFLLLVSAAVAQPDSAPRLEPSYEIALQILIGSNDASKGELPASLSPISRHLKNNFSFSNYRLANTYLGRISNTGNFDYKSVSNIFGEEHEADAQTFLEWSIGNFRSIYNVFQARLFRFGARVPVRVGSTKDETGKPLPVMNYESVGLNMNMIGLPANTPTLVGTISLPKTSGTLFLVATIRRAEL